jgi:hypothetical protein
MEQRTGISGLTSSFKESLADLPPGSKVTFVGSVAVCTPFAELLSYAVKDLGFKLVYVPKANLAQARSIVWIENIGFSAGGEVTDPKGADAIVILGGLAMPKFGCSVDQVKSSITAISDGKNARVVGVCFMSIFERTGWTKELPFNRVIDATMTVQMS